MAHLSDATPNTINLWECINDAHHLDFERRTAPEGNDGPWNTLLRGFGQTAALSGQELALQAVRAGDNIDGRTVEEDGWEITVFSCYHGGGATFFFSKDGVASVIEQERTSFDDCEDD